MPAKSGVGGGVVAVLPGQIGLAVFSPKLDIRGNSVRGLAVCNKISNDFGLHMLRTTTINETSIIRNRYFTNERRSKCIRCFKQLEILDEHGKRNLVLELSGDLTFVTAEIISSEVLNIVNNIDLLILDFKRIASMDQAALGSLVFFLFAALALAKKCKMVMPM